jgi:Methyltransferase domain
VMKPALLVELGVDRGESYFAFCQAADENQTGTRCFGIDTWRGDQHAGGYDETTFAQVAEHNRNNYESFSTLLRSNFDDALARFAEASIDVLHLDGLHTEMAVRHDVESWLPKLRPGGILLLHDVRVRNKDFGVWKIWAELQQQSRTWTFEDGPGLGAWQKPPERTLPGFLDELLAPPNESNAALARYYTERAQATQEKIARHWRDGSIRNTPFSQQTIIQVFHSTDGSHREEASIYARVGHEGWKDVRIELPPDAGAAPLRIDFVSALTSIEVASIVVSKGNAIAFFATEQTGFASIIVAGDAELLPHPSFLKLRITGIDPQLFLPPLSLPSGSGLLTLQMRLRVEPS